MFTTSTPLAAAASADIHRLQCPVVFASDAVALPDSHPAPGPSVVQAQRDSNSAAFHSAVMEAQRGGESACMECTSGARAAERSAEKKVSAAERSAEGASAAVLPRSAAERFAEGASAAVLPRSAATLACRCADSAYMPFGGLSGQHFMPFCAPERLAAGVVRGLIPRQEGVSLAEHVRWLGVELQRQRLARAPQRCKL